MIFFYIFLLLFPHQICQAEVNSNMEGKLLNDLLKDYNKMSRPVKNLSSPLEVTINIGTFESFDLDEISQTISVLLYITVSWVDKFLTWNPEEYSGINQTRLPAGQIWIPDLQLQHTPIGSGMLSTESNAILDSSGLVKHTPPGTIKTICQEMDLYKFPYDTQTCTIEHLSFTHPSNELFLRLGDFTLDQNTFQSQEWQLLNVTSRIEINYYGGPYPFQKHIICLMVKRIPNYYISNMIYPYAVLASVAGLGFTLPPDSADKLSLGVSVLLSTTFYAGMVADIVPVTTSMPFLGLYCLVMMSLVAFSVVSTLAVINLHNRGEAKMSYLQKTIFLKFLPSLLFMEKKSKPSQVQRNTNHKGKVQVETLNDSSKEVEQEQAKDWKFAAKVLNEFCMIIFSAGFFIIFAYTIFFL
ncbi:acetylcholine receptor subunit alpha [Eurytemora carolleeae]|uniref:acetylcholine receptor subunit alpha n=1 Tax=Eurytemora carolleeae TaxID=1294199 RepID=UPI000C78C901|nr:acetylcholine receptor subunit alpha [Eurytemora carolleeae]|eukprot:XP_023334348.1 acetylcholine receptor subunit alpha-like [Eurytemora affinis]